MQFDLAKAELGQEFDGDQLVFFFPDGSARIARRLRRG
jgi:hypothetical protein